MQNKDLKDARGFREVTKDFQKFCGNRYIFCTWGELDLLELQRNMKFYHMGSFSDRPFKYLDAQKLFSICFEDGKSRRTLIYAVEFLGIEKSKPFHRAFSDAYYTAKVLEKIDDYVIDKYVSFDIFERAKNKRNEIKHYFPNYFKYISMEYNNKTELFNDRDVSSTKCYLCNRKTQSIVDTFTNNGKHYYGVGYCKRHGYIKSKIRIKRTEEKNVYVVKTMKIVKREVVNQIKLQSEKIEEESKQD